MSAGIVRLDAYRVFPAGTLPIEETHATQLQEAVAAGNWALVGWLAGELQHGASVRLALSEASPAPVVSLADERARRHGGGAQ